MIFNGQKASNTILKLWSHELSQLPNGIWIKTHETFLKIDEPHFTLVTNQGQESQCQGHHVASPHLRRHREAAPQQPRPAAAARRHRCARWLGAAHGGEGRGQQPRCGGAVEDLGMVMGWWDDGMGGSKNPWEIETNWSQQEKMRICLSMKNGWLGKLGVKKH